MADYVFPFLITLAIAVDVAYFSWIVHAAYKHDMMWTTVKSCGMYVRVAEGIIVGAGIITSVLAGAIEASSPIPHSFTGRTILFLAVAIVFSFLTIMVLTRATESAIGREMRKPSQGEAKLANGELQGHLSWAEFLVEVVCGFIALGAFLIGILYLGRIGYILSQR